MQHSTAASALNRKASLLAIQHLFKIPACFAHRIDCEFGSLAGYQPAVYPANESQSEAVLRAVYAVSASIQDMRGL